MLHDIPEDERQAFLDTSDRVAAAIRESDSWLLQAKSEHERSSPKVLVDAALSLAAAFASRAYETAALWAPPTWGEDYVATLTSVVWLKLEGLALQQRTLWLPTDDDETQFEALTAEVDRERLAFSLQHNKILELLMRP